MTELQTVYDSLSKRKDIDDICRDLSEYWSLDMKDEIEIERLWLEEADKHLMEVPVIDLINGGTNLLALPEEFIQKAAAKIFAFLKGDN